MFSTKSVLLMIFPWIGTGVTVKISEGCLILIADCNEVQELREELYQVKKVVKGMKNGMFSVLNEV
ncbi:SymE family type I addiction module toxin [Escherichia coli]|nr:hypothetical protein [Escherichia coli]